MKTTNVGECTFVSFSEGLAEIGGRDKPGLFGDGSVGRSENVILYFLHRPLFVNIHKRHNGQISPDAKHKKNCFGNTQHQAASET